MIRSIGMTQALFACVLAFAPSLTIAAEAELVALDKPYRTEIQPLVKRFCHRCHAGDRLEAEIDLSTFATLADVRREPGVWQKVGEMLESGQMPPRDSNQPTEAERTRLRKWVRDYLTQEAQARAGDPGRVVLRRLNNAEYKWTLRDLTGVAALDPAREFPVDGAAGEGFTNTGNALVMSPALVTKYLDAAKAVAGHAVLLPDGFRFSSHTTRRDWTQETLAKIRAFYERHTASGADSTAELRGSEFYGTTVRGLSDGGVIPLERYLAALLNERARQPIPEGLSPKYLRTLQQTLDSAEPSPLLTSVRERWRSAKPGDEAALAREIATWQRSLWKFNPVGHIGKIRGPKSWLEPVSPLQSQADVRFAVPSDATGDLVLYLTVGDAGDGAEHDVAVWQHPRFVAPGRPEILLKDVRDITAAIVKRREQVFARTEAYLTAASEAAAMETPDFEVLATKHAVDREALLAWLDCLGVSGNGPVKLEGHFTQKLNDGTYAFVTGWGTGATPNVVANSSDEHVRIPGNLKGHGVAVHPSPTLDVVVGWQSPMTGTVKVTPRVAHAHPECGNGVMWTLEHRRGSNRQRLASGVAHGGTPPKIEPVESLDVQRGDVLALTIGPRDGNHSCDLTAVDLTIATTTQTVTQTWDLAADVSPDIQAANPHADRQGNAAVWHFCTQPTAAGNDGGFVIPKGSVLEQWKLAKEDAEKARLAQEVKRLLTNPSAQDAPDAAWVVRLSSFRGPIVGRLFPKDLKPSSEATEWGLDPALFGVHPDGVGEVDANSLCVKAPSVVEVRVPADLVAGAELVTTAAIHPASRENGAAQFQVLTTRPERTSRLSLSANGGLVPVVAAEGSTARTRFEAAFDEVRTVFPIALCYTKIVPVDEVVTLTLYHREDGPLVRLMLDDAHKAELDRLWNELHYISHDAPALVDALEQIIQYATQDSDPTVLEPLREPYAKRAAEFRQWLVETEPSHLTELLKFADRAYRRPLTGAETAELRGLYAGLRQQELSHDNAFRLTLARVLVAPAFLYRLETPAEGTAQQPVTHDELASRLSYFLWSSLPDDELRAVAAQGRLQQPEVLLAQTRRMLRDPKARRLATEFAAQWLHIYGFAHHDEKSDRHFPTFAGLRSAMVEESTLFFTDLFQNNGSLLELVDADHTFLNEDLAKHYGIPDVTGPEWRKVTGTRRYGRGGILTQATTLSTQAGASRTSPILRGNWLSEVVLGERLPRPPKDVPQLPETAPEGLTERQLIEMHSSDERCAKCHARIDPPGFALENFDAIGRFRETDASGLKIDANTQLQDGTKLDGLNGLRTWLLTSRRDAFVRQFCKKLLGYALGRAVQLSDEPLLTEIQTELAPNGFKVHTVFEKIILSRQFREIRGREFVEAE